MAKQSDGCQSKAAISKGIARHGYEQRRNCDDLHGNGRAMQGEGWHCKGNAARCKGIAQDNMAEHGKGTAKRGAAME